MPYIFEKKGVLIAEGLVAGWVGELLHILQVLPHGEVLPVQLLHLGVANIPEIRAQSELIEKILHTDYLDNAGINEFEHIRECLRNLMKYLPHDDAIYNTNFTDDILSVEWKELELENDDLKNYKAKAEFHVRQHQDKPTIAKLRSNVPLTAEDVKELETILWSEVGTRQDYEAEVGQEATGRVCPGDRGHEHERRQGGLRPVLRRCQSGQPADLLCQPDRGVHRSQRRDEGSVCAP